MTVSSSTNKVSYSGNGSLTTFAYSFKIFDQGDLTVILRAADGTETVQTITTHYTVSGVGSASGGNVVFGTAPASGGRLLLASSRRTRSIAYASSRTRYPACSETLQPPRPGRSSRKASGPSEAPMSPRESFKFRGRAFSSKQADGRLWPILLR